MYYSIYPRLRVIFTYLPDQKTRRNLIESESLSDFTQQVKNLKLLSRFPLHEQNIESFLNNQAFNFAQEILARFDESSAIFFYDFLRHYELQDIKNVLYHRPGKFILFQDQTPSLEEIGEKLAELPWKNAWQKGLKRYQDSHKKMDIEFSLESRYYSILLESLNNLSWSDKKITKQFLVNWVQLVNQLWYQRLSENYNLEDFEIKQYIATRSIIELDFKTIKGLKRNQYYNKFYNLCYETFKREMYTMASVLAFFHLFKIEIQNLLAIYNGLKYNIKNKIIYNVVEES